MHRDRNRACVVWSGGLASDCGPRSIDTINAMPERPLPPPRPFAVGRTAEVFAVSADEIVKVLKPGFDDEAEFEAEIAARLDPLGVPAPRFLGLTRLNDQPALRYERIGGPSMLEAL